MTLTADVQGTAPFPMNVWATGIFASSANAVSASAAPPRIAPFPARMIGCRARLRRAAARFTLSGSGAGRLARSRASGLRPRGASSCPTFSGSSTWVGPGRSAVAILKGIHQFEVLLARDAEGEADALVLKAVDQQRRGLHGSQMPPLGLVHSVQNGPGEVEGAP